MIRTPWKPNSLFNMVKLPSLTPRDVIRILEQHGFALDHSSGSHRVFYNAESGKRVVVPFHEFLRAKHKIDTKDPLKAQRTTLSRFVASPIKVERIKRYSRDELHER